MKIIDTNDTNKVTVENIPEGVVFRHEGKYFLKTANVFTYADVDDYLDDHNLYRTDELEQYTDYYNALVLSVGGFCYINEDTLVEPLHTELHIV